MERIAALHRQLDGSMSILKLRERGSISVVAPGIFAGTNATARTVFSDGLSNVQYADFGPDSSLVEHDHGDTIQYLIVEEGTIEVRMITPEGEMEFAVQRGACFRVPPHSLHSVRSKGGARFISVCVPPEKGFE